MTELELLKENNAILKVLLKNQAITNIICSDLSSYLNSEQSFDKELHQQLIDLRNRKAEIIFKLLMNEVQDICNGNFNENSIDFSPY